MPEQPMSEKERWETRFGAPDYIFGKAVFGYWPMDKLGILR